MTEKSNSKVLKVLIGILGVCLIGLVFYTVSFYRENKQNLSNLQLEKAHLQQELTTLQGTYQEMRSENKFLNADLKKEQARVETLLDSLKTVKIDFKTLSKYRVQTDLLKIERRRLNLVIDSLANQNEQLKSEVDSTNLVLKEHQKYTDSLNLKNQELADKVEKASKLKITDLEVKGMILRNNGTLVPSNRARKIDQIETCFSILSNELVKKGTKIFYLQIINPKNNVIGKTRTIKFGQQELRYSKTIQVDYEQEESDVCVLIDLAVRDALEGRYVVNLFDTEHLIASFTFELH